MPEYAFELFGMSDALLRGIAFVGAFVALSVLEAMLPKRRRVMPRLTRWRTNGAMLIVSTILVRLISWAAPLVAASAAALFAGTQRLGLLHLTDWPAWLEIALAIILLDLAIWFQHVLSHKVPVFWRLHRVHHSDRDLDASSALRFHPGEIALSAFYKLAIILALGPAVLAVIIFEIILNASAIFNHANIALPKWLDRLLRTLIVTPDMHRVHHSILHVEHDTNYGFCLSVWDRIFGTYTSQPSAGHTGMTIGLSQYQSRDPQELKWSLLLPIR